MKKSILNLSILLFSSTIFNIFPDYNAQFSISKEGWFPVFPLKFRINGSGVQRELSTDSSEEEIMIDDVRLTECYSIIDRRCNKLQQIIQNTTFERTSLAKLEDQIKKIAGNDFNVKISI